MYRYDGVQLWNLRQYVGMHYIVWWSSFISFFFLYPSTFNLLEVSTIVVSMHASDGVVNNTAHYVLCFRWQQLKSQHCTYGKLG